MGQPATEPILLELGEERWGAFIDSIGTWLRTVQLAQISFRHLAEDTAAKIDDPRVREAMERIAESARRHEQQVDELYRLIDRRPAMSAQLLGVATAKGRQALGAVLGIAGHAPGVWHDLRQLLLANLNAIGAFGTVEQLGLTIGLPDLAQTAFVIVREKSTEQMVIEEYMLELAPQSILYGDDRLGKATGHEPQPASSPSDVETQPELPVPGRPDATIVGKEMPEQDK